MNLHQREPTVVYEREVQRVRTSAHLLTEPSGTSRAAVPATQFVAAPAERSPATEINQAMAFRAPITAAPHCATQVGARLPQPVPSQFVVAPAERSCEQAMAFRAPVAAVPRCVTQVVAPSRPLPQPVVRTAPAAATPDSCLMWLLAAQVIAAQRTAERAVVRRAAPTRRSREEPPFRPQNACIASLLRDDLDRSVWAAAENGTPLRQVQQVRRAVQLLGRAETHLQREMSATRRDTIRCIADTIGNLRVYSGRSGGQRMVRTIHPSDRIYLNDDGGVSVE